MESFTILIANASRQSKADNTIGFLLSNNINVLTLLQMNNEIIVKTLDLHPYIWQE